MREPQVVRQPRVQKRSLWARGTPVSAWPSPRAMRSSAARAWARLFSGSVEMNALSAPPRRSMRSRKWRVASTLEMALARRRRESSATEGLSFTGCRALTTRPLLDHPGHEVQAVLDLRGDRLVGGAQVGLCRHVLAQALGEGLGMRHRLDAGGIHGLHALDHPEDGIELGGQGRDLPFIDLDAGKTRDAPDFSRGKHRKRLRKGAKHAADSGYYIAP